MSDTIYLDDYKIDEFSQRILLALDREPRTVPELERQAGLDHHKQVTHRTEDAQLGSAGLVEQIDDDPITYAITEDGQEFLSNEYLEASSFEEAQQMALEARDASDAALKTVSELRDEIEALQESLASRAGLQSAVEELQATLDEHDLGQIEENRSLLSSLRSVVDGRQPIIERLDERLLEIEGELQEITDRLDDLEETQQDVEQTIDRLWEVRSDQEETIDEFRSSLETSDGNRRELTERFRKLESKVEELEEDNDGLLF